MDVHLPIGTTYILVIDTDAYSGNFERQLCGYATGIVDVERGHGQREAMDAIAKGGDLVHGIIAKSKTLTHFEYGEVSNAIRPTPGRLNDGRGVHYDAEPGETGWPAYESVAIFFGELLTEDEMDFIWDRAKEYAAKPLTQWQAPFTVKDMYIVEVVVEPVERRVEPIRSI